MENQSHCKIKDELRVRVTNVHFNVANLKLAHGLFERSYTEFVAQMLRPVCSIQSDGLFHHDFRTYLEPLTLQQREESVEAVRFQAMRLVDISIKIADEILNIIQLQELLLSSNPRLTVLTDEDIFLLNVRLVFSKSMEQSASEFLTTI